MVTDRVSEAAKRRAGSLSDEAAALLIGLTHIPDRGYPLDAAVSPQALHLLQDDVVVHAPIRVQGRLRKVAEQVFFEGQIRGRVTAPCGRCLEDAQMDFEAEAQGVFLPPSALAPGADEPGPETDELDLYRHDGAAVDLRPLVREQVVLALPVQPLCREDCAGLCQVCGANRNVEACTCQTEAGDPRFAVLDQLRRRLSS